MRLFNFISTLSIILLLSTSCSQNKDNFQQEQKHLDIDSTSYVRKTEMSDYSEYKSITLSEGFVSQEQIAIQIAESILIPIYGLKQIHDQRPYNILLKDSIWIIEGYLPQRVDGGVFYIEIDKYSGKIYKVLHTK